jgi:hypothetical protein
VPSLLLSKVRAAYKQGTLLKAVFASFRLLGQKVKFHTFRRFDFQAIPDSKTFLTWHKRPRLTSNNLSPSSMLEHSDTAIVLQGPVRREIRFVAETVKLYTRLHPGVHIIVSTWDDTPIEDVLLLGELGAEIVLSQPPKYSGVSNTNLQLVSSRAGLEAAKKMGAEFSLKMRVDQRLYSPASLSILKMLAGVPTGPTFRPSSLKRIAALSTDTFMSRIYGLSDFLTFGRTEDVLEYWSAPITVPKVAVGGTEMNDSSQLADCTKEFPEVYVCSSFLERTGWHLGWSIQDWHKALVSRFAIADASTLDFFWNKYSSREHLWRRYGEISHLREVTWGDWLELLSAERLESP